jgi:excisionase family DNA binding protein
VDNLFYTVKELAEILKLSTEQIRRKLRNKEIPGVKIGNEWRVLKKDFEKWIKERKEGK